jgi:hypothetical protein
MDAETKVIASTYSFEFRQKFHESPRNRNRNRDSIVRRFDGIGIGIGRGLYYLDRVKTLIEDFLASRVLIEFWG